MDEARSSPDAPLRALRKEVLSDAFHTLYRVTFELRRRDGSWVEQEREVFDTGRAATILLHDPRRGTVVLTRQFRLPAFLNGHPDGMLLETPAGLVEDDSPEETIRREVEEETGYRATSVRRLYELYLSPGSVTERAAFFAGEYDGSERAAEGGGRPEEGEDIEVVELPLDEAIAMRDRGEIADGKTVLLLLWAELNLRRA